MSARIMPSKEKVIASRVTDHFQIRSAGLRRPSNRRITVGVFDGASPAVDCEAIVILHVRQLILNADFTGSPIAAGPVWEVLP